MRVKFIVNIFFNFAFLKGKKIMSPYPCTLPEAIPVLALPMPMYDVRTQ